jgi:hypothetical protein
MTLPYGIVDMASIVTFTVPPGMELVPCPPYPRPRPNSWGPTTAQTNAVTGVCWRAPCTSPATVADHQPPLIAAWVMGGCHMPPPPSPGSFEAWASSPQAVPRSHCLAHSQSQGGHMSRMFRMGEAVKAVARAMASLA